MPTKTLKLDFDYSESATPEDVIEFLKGVPEHANIHFWSTREKEWREIHTLEFNSGNNTVEIS